MAKKRTSHNVQVRRRVVRRLLVEGMPEGAVVRNLIAGIQGPSGPIKVSEATARRDLAAVSDEFRGLFDSNDAIEREIGVAWEQYKRIAKLAQAGKKPNYHAAIAALDRVVKIAASRSPRWSHLAGAAARKATGDLAPLVPVGNAELLARAQDLLGMEDAELRKHHRQLRNRMDTLGLELHDGGELPAKAAGGDT